MWKKVASVGSLLRMDLKSPAKPAPAQGVEQCGEPVGVNVVYFGDEATYGATNVIKLIINYI